MNYDLKHHKDFHSIQLQGLKAKEKNIFMSLAFKAQNQESTLLEYNVSELAELIGYVPKVDLDIYKYLENTYDSLQRITYRVDTEEKLIKFCLFPMIKINKKEGLVTFQINEHYKYMINAVIAPFTIQNIMDYNKLSSKHSKVIYSFLKQWEGIKAKTITIEEFKEKLGIENYPMHNIDKRILAPIMKELPQHFPNLKIEKIKTRKKVSHISFTWEEKKELPLLKELENAEIDQAKIDNEAYFSFFNLFENSKLSDRERTTARFIYISNKNNSLVSELKERQKISIIDYFKNNSLSA